MRTLCHDFRRNPRISALRRYLGVAIVAIMPSLGWQWIGPQTAPLRAAEIGFVEKFALADDRAGALAELIPGTDEHYFYQALHAQHQQRYDEVEGILQRWIAKHGETPRAREILHRQALLTYDENAERTLKFVRSRLDLRFDHQAKSVDRAADLPVVLDAKRVSSQAFFDQAIRDQNNTGRFESTALPALVRFEKLTSNQRQHLLNRLRRPDYEGLVELLLEDLNLRKFGSHPVHRLLLPEQLDRLSTARPNLLNDEIFIATYLGNLHAGPENDWRYDSEARVAHFTRLWQFVRTLPPSQNSLKAHILYHLLGAKVRTGDFDQKLFLEYLRVPRTSPIVAREFIEASRRDNTPIAQLNADFRNMNMSAMPQVGDDQSLVRSHLEQLFVEADNYQPFADYLDESYVKRVFAETKILHGLGDLQKWTAWLSPAQYQQLRDRVDIRFSDASREQYGSDEPVSLDVHIKNVQTLIVKIYEINSLNYYLAEGREVTTDLNLDGLKPNIEKRFEYDEASYRRVSRHFEFPELEKPGVYAVDFIGNGKSSRALVRKGQLIAISRPTAAGQAISVLNENREPLKDASVYLNGRQFTANELGEVLLPFTTSPGRKSIVLEHQGRAALHEIVHRDEAYELSGGFYIDRESLVRREKSRLVIRPKLTVNGAPVSLDALEDVQLTIASVNLQGIPSSETVKPFKLEDQRDAVHEFYTPAHAKSIQVTLQAKIRRLSRSDKQDVSATASFSLNRIRTSKRFLTCHLTRAEGLYAVDVLGLSGEPYAGLPIQVSCKHADYTNPIHTSLKTAANGRAVLGMLSGINYVTVRLPDGSQRQWQLRDAQYRYPSTMHRRQGSTIALPYLGSAEQATRDEFSLLEIRGGKPVSDRFSHLQLNGGRLEITKLPPGDYVLRLLREGQEMTIRVTAGKEIGTALVGDQRVLDTDPTDPLFIAAVEVKEEAIRVLLENGGPARRLHVFATRFHPDYSPFDRLGVTSPGSLGWMRPAPALTRYVEERAIGDELQYIIDRQYAEKFPGNLLDPPSLLINPWAVRSTQTGSQQAADGSNFAREAAPESESQDRRNSDSPDDAPADSSVYLDYVPRPSTVLLHVDVDENGVATIQREALNGLHMVHLVAVDDNWTDYREISLAEEVWTPVDLRQQNTFPLNAHVSQQQRIKSLLQGETLRLREEAVSRMMVYDSLEKIYGLYRTMLPNSALAQFEFIARWERLTAEEKRDFYDQYASHELHLFIARRDPKFFRSAVRPLLENKKEKQFMDRYLLGEDLQEFSKPWAFQQLNTLEKVLLADRHPELRPSIRQHIDDLVRQNPVTRDVSITRFETALRWGMMSWGGQADREQAISLSLNGPVDSEDKMALGDLDQVMDSVQGIELRALQLEEKKAVEEYSESLERAKLAAKRPAAQPRGFRQNADRYYDLVRQGGRDVLFRQADQTKEWAESQYFRIENVLQNAQLVGPRALWQDYVQRDPSAPFLSGRFTESAHTLTEAIAALALLDLPLQAKGVEPEYADGQIIVKSDAPAIVVYEESATGKTRDDIPVLTSQRFFDDSPEYQSRNAKQDLVYVEGEFVRGVPYGCQIIVTNPSASNRPLSVLIQIPAGAIALGDSRSTKTVPLDIGPFQTKIVTYSFYFPLQGEFDHYPVQVALDEEVVAFAEADRFNVLTKPIRFDTESWAYVSQRGTDADVLRFVAEQPLETVNLDDVAYRLRDREFYDKFIAALHERRVYHRTTWSYAVYHNDRSQIDQFLQHEADFVSHCGPILKSPILTIDPLARGSYQHYEYRPLINARAHQLGTTRQILNDRMHQQYHRLLDILARQRELRDTDRLAVIYYLTAQGRTEESLTHFQQINRDSLESQLQYDYMAAYLDFFIEDPQRAEEIAAKYADFPVNRWQQAFAAISSQIAELSGGASQVVDDENRSQTQTARADTEPRVQLKQQGEDLVLVAHNVDEVEAKFYAMDIEVLFSRKPFLSGYADQLSYIRPNSSQRVAVAQEGETKIAIPDSLRKENLMVEVRGKGKAASLMVLANQLRVDVSENYGQLQVRQSQNNRALHTVYVKVFARHKDGAVHFYKDGYTDLRGRFDYASLSTNQLDHVQQFAILVLSQEHGAVIHEVAPPAR